MHAQISRESPIVAELRADILVNVLEVNIIMIMIIIIMAVVMISSSSSITVTVTLTFTAFNYYDYDYYSNLITILCFQLSVLLLLLRL